MPTCLHPGAVTALQVVPRSMGLNEYGAGEVDSETLYRHWCPLCGADWYDEYPVVRQGGLVTFVSPQGLTSPTTSPTLPDVNDCLRTLTPTSVNECLQEPKDG